MSECCLLACKAHLLAWAEVWAEGQTGIQNLSFLRLGTILGECCTLRAGCTYPNSNLIARMSAVSKMSARLRVLSFGPQVSYFSLAAPAALSPLYQGRYRCSSHLQRARRHP